MSIRAYSAVMQKTADTERVLMRPARGATDIYELKHPITVLNPTKAGDSHHEEGTRHDNPHAIKSFLLTPCNFAHFKS